MCPAGSLNSLCIPWNTRIHGTVWQGCVSAHTTLPFSLLCGSCICTGGIMRTFPPTRSRTDSLLGWAWRKENWWLFKLHVPLIDDIIRGGGQWDESQQLYSWHTKASIHSTICFIWYLLICIFNVVEASYATTTCHLFDQNNDMLTLTESTLDYVSSDRSWYTGNVLTQPTPGKHV